MSDASAALGALGSDLAFSVSFGIGRELLDAAQDSGISEDELVACVLVISILLSALPRSVRMAQKELTSRGWIGKALQRPAAGASRDGGLASFASLLVDIARRIAVSISVQLLAANVRAKQPNRAVRVISLLSVAVFFLFLEASSSIGSKVRTE